MCKIYSTRKSSKYVYIYLEDEKRGIGGARKIRIEDYNWAKKFKNMDFLSAISLPTKDKIRYEDEIMSAVHFIDPDVTYSKYSW